MSAYFENPARPILTVADAVSLRAEPSALLRTGMLAVFETPALLNVLAKYDSTSIAVDDGLNVWKPNDVLVGDPGRWLIFGGESAGPSTYVLRKTDGSIDGLTADFSSQVIRVNYDIGANDPVPAVLCGLSVDRGAIAGVERNRATVLWDEVSQTWNVVFSTTNDTVLGLHIPLVVGGLRSSGGGTSGFVRLRENETITANVGGSTYNLAGASNAALASFGDPFLDQAIVDASNDIRVRSRLSEVRALGRHFRVRDASDLNETLDVDVAAATTKVYGDLNVYDGANLRAYFDVAPSLVLGLLGLLQQKDTGLLAKVDVGLGSVPQTVDATATTIATLPVPASGSVAVAVFVKGTQSDGSNAFSQLCANEAKRTGAAAPTLAAGAPGVVFATIQNTFAIVRPSLQFVISGNDLLIQVVGKAATTINWAPWYVAISR